MHKLFVKTRNVKNFIGLMNNLIDKSNEVPKMGLVYGDPGLGKTQTAVWWATRNDAVYVRAQNKMTSRWLMEKIVFELGESPSRKMANLMEQCIAHLRLKPQVIIIDEVDYLISRCKIVETLRDVHYLTGAPVVLIGMQEAKTKLGKFGIYIMHYGICAILVLFDKISNVFLLFAITSIITILLCYLMTKVSFLKKLLNYN